MTTPDPPVAAPCQRERPHADQAPADQRYERTAHMDNLNSAGRQRSHRQHADRDDEGLRGKRSAHHLRGQQQKRRGEQENEQPGRSPGQVGEHQGQTSGAASDQAALGEDYQSEREERRPDAQRICILEDCVRLRFAVRCPPVEARVDAGPCLSDAGRSGCLIVHSALASRLRVRLLLWPLTGPGRFLPAVGRGRSGPRRRNRRPRRRSPGWLGR